MRSELLMINKLKSVHLHPIAMYHFTLLELKVTLNVYLGKMVKPVQMLLDEV